MDIRVIRLARRAFNMSLQETYEWAVGKDAAGDGNKIPYLCHVAHARICNLENEIKKLKKQLGQEQVLDVARK